MVRIFISLPVTDLERSRAFYTALGWGINPMFTDDNALCIAVDSDKFLMLLRREFFATFTDKQIADPTAQVQVSISFDRASRGEVDALVAAGLAAGGTEPRPAQDYGYMYSRDLDDPDGNGIGLFYMEPQTADPDPGAAASAQN